LATLAYSSGRYSLVYDRCGEKVFESNDPKLRWDGTYRGRLMDADVFCYSLNVVLINGEKVLSKGNISLIR